jgi:solute carrier family 25 phosphate transporter 23/24/25/41
VATMVRTEGVVSLYKGLVPTLIGIAPYAALNFASYDMLKRYAYEGGRIQQSTVRFL